MNFKTYNPFNRNANVQKTSNVMRLTYDQGTNTINMSKGKTKASGLVDGGKKLLGNTAQKLKNSQLSVTKMAPKTFAATAKSVGGAGVLALGAGAMISIAMMRGALNTAHDKMMERYMQDSRYSSRLINQTRLGSGSQNTPLSIGNHAGLSLAMYKNRHGF